MRCNFSILVLACFLVPFLCLVLFWSDVCKKRIRCGLSWVRQGSQAAAWPLVPPTPPTHPCFQSRVHYFSSSSTLFRVCLCATRLWSTLCYLQVCLCATLCFSALLWATLRYLQVCRPLCELPLVTAKSKSKDLSPAQRATAGLSKGSFTTSGKTARNPNFFGFVPAER